MVMAIFRLHCPPFTIELYVEIQANTLIYIRLGPNLEVKYVDFFFTKQDSREPMLTSNTSALM